jgi:hypothetical protein
MSDEKYKYKVLRFDDSVRRFDDSGNKENKVRPVEWISGEQFEETLNHYAHYGWRVVSNGGAGEGTQGHSTLSYVVIMEKRVS